MHTVALVARLLLAAVFAVSAVAKVRDRAGARSAVQAFGVPIRMAPVVASALPLLEAVCAGLLLAADPAAALGSLAGLVLLAAFTTAMLVNLARGRHPECHCFGRLGNGRIGWTSVARNAVLIALGAASLLHVGARGWVGAELASHRGRDLLVAGAGAALMAVITALGLLVRALLTQYGAVLLRLEALEVATGLAAAPVAPDFALPDLDGELVALSDALQRGRPVLVTFIDPHCAHCEELVPDLSSWQQEPGGPTVLVLSTGSVEANRSKISAAPALRVLRQEDWEVATAYGVTATPAAVLVGTDGRRSVTSAYAVDGIRRLYEGASRRPQQAHPLHIEHTTSTEGPLPAPGDLLPKVRVARWDGQEMTLESLGDGTVVLFWRADCNFCEEICPDVALLSQNTPLAIVTGSPAAHIRGSGLQSPILRETSMQLSEALRIPGTPSAVRIRAGHVDSPVAVGGPEVLHLLRVSAQHGQRAAVNGAGSG